MNFLNVLEAPRLVKRVLMVAADLVILPAAFLISILLRIDFTSVPLRSDTVPALAITIIFTVAFFARIGLYRAVIRFIGQDVFNTVIKGVSFSALVLAFTMLLFETGIPRSIPFIYWAVSLILVAGSRWAVREFINGQNNSHKKRVAIFGAGANGQDLLRALKNNYEYKPVALIDDDKRLWGSIFQGVKVISPHLLGSFIRNKKIDHIFLALPSVSSQQRKNIIQRLEPYAVQVKSVPTFDELMSGEARVDQLHDVDEKDLLGRDPVPPEPDLLSACIEGKVVMVTGSGGSIGSELCRQIVELKPERLILFELSEYGLYSINKELKKIIQSQQLSVDVVPLLGNVQNQSHITSIMQSYAVQTVYHAAAYKHVPLVEQNMMEGVKNNVYGTYLSARAALEAGVETFVLISTDKAVRPTNVMGASKRLAELILQGLAKEVEDTDLSTRFCMVRFGNVLSSSGSVVPLFQKQIQEGGPVTVTHPDIIRYFMTIPEAAQLVIQAGAMAKGGDVFLLDMGEPVKIAELARTLIHLSGHRVRNNDYSHDASDGIEIKYTGLRPGEKLYEELLIDGSPQGTGHPRIMRAEESSLAWEYLEKILARIDQANQQADCQQIREILLSLEAGYQPESGINDLLSLQKKASGSNTKVVSIKKLHGE